MTYTWYRITTDNPLLTISMLKKQGYTVIRPLDYDDVIWTAASSERDSTIIGLLHGTVQQFPTLKSALRKHRLELNIGNIDTDLMGI